ncbi:MAG: PaaI family thioesterase [Crocinitomicaceae bacterium]|nr:PaaI family thioesterase [Crocinitomicaceae bacterium]
MSWVQIPYFCRMKLKQIPLEMINSFNKNTLMEVLEIECIELGDDYLKSRMPVKASTHQPAGLLHGGASAAVIESIGSMGSVLLIDIEKEVPVGLEINANHIAGVRDGFVIATGKIVHAGKRTHVWQVDIHHEETGKLVCTGRLTVMIVPR